ncbi:MAG: 23S rRNA (guanosine(2251)-2'-O)-methyltransferase RlmB [Candidatus Omnitrophica bacterium]|nr:23S rRNA (guanosine(2251)-2'-O)-methyltransferase RlmB [Candidatus Omnitrophota bacterium]
MMNLYGKNQVIERLASQPNSIKKIFFNQKSVLAELKTLANEKKIPYTVLSEKEFLIISKDANTQGVIAQVDEFHYEDLDNLLRRSKQDKYVLIALSNITDPQNLGSILRTAACFGNFALIIPKHRTASINETVLKVACGGENHVPIVQVTNLISAIQAAKDAGYWVAGSVVDNGEAVTTFKFPFPLCLVIGSEDKGIRHGLLNHLDYKLTLPMPGKELSLNAAVATAVFCYEIMRQRSLLIENK